MDRIPPPPSPPVVTKSHRGLYWNHLAPPAWVLTHQALMPWGYICESVAELFATRVGIVLHHHHSEYCTKSLRLSSKLRGWFSFTVFVRCLSSVCVAVYPLCVSPSVLCVCSLSILCVCPSSVFCVCPPSVFCVCVRPLSSVYVRPLSSVYVHPLSSVFVRSLLNP